LHVIVAGQAEAITFKKSVEKHAVIRMTFIPVIEVPGLVHRVVESQVIGLPASQLHAHPGAYRGDKVRFRRKPGDRIGVARPVKDIVVVLFGERDVWPDAHLADAVNQNVAGIDRLGANARRGESRGNCQKTPGTL